MTRKVLVLAAAIAVFGLASGSAFAQQNVTGAWQLTLATPQGDNTVDVTFKQDGQNITGELVSPLGTAPFKGTIVQDAMKVVASVDMQGTPLELTFDAKVTGDTLAGTVKFGDFGDAPFSGKRKPAGAPSGAGTNAAAAAARPAAPAASATTSSSTTTTTTGGGALSGTWNLTVEIAGNQMPITAVMQQNGNAITGSMATPQGEVPIKGTMNGNNLSLDFEVPGGMAVSMTGTLSATGLAGKMTIPGFGDGDWTGKKAN
jgi:hypothetical protein